MSEIIQVKQNDHALVLAADVRLMPMAELWQRFIKAAGQRSINTARAYQTGAGTFLQWLGERTGEAIAERTKQGRKTVWEIRGNTDILQEIELSTFDDFGLFLQASGSTQKTIDQRLGAVNSFLSVALRDKAISREQGIDLDLKPYKARQRHNDQPVGRRLKPAEVRKLREIVTLRAKTDNKAARDRAILDFMLFAGLRRSEVASLTLGDIKQDGGRWWLIFEGKGNKTRRVKVHDELFKSLTDWLQALGRSMGNGDAGAVFCNLDKAGNPTKAATLGEAVIGRLVTEYGAAAGLAPLEAPKDENDKSIRGVILSPHDLRRTCARNAYDNGATIYQVQTMLGHSDPKTTIKYIGGLEDDSNTAIDKVDYSRG